MCLLSELLLRCLQTVRHWFQSSTHALTLVIPSNVPVQPHSHLRSKWWESITSRFFR